MIGEDYAVLAIAGLVILFLVAFPYLARNK
jgi:hypothetical protein